MRIDLLLIVDHSSIERKGINICEVLGPKVDRLHIYYQRHCPLVALFLFPSLSPLHASFLPRHQQ